MTQEKETQRLEHLAFHALLHPAEWPVALSELAEMFSCPVAMLALIDSEKHLLLHFQQAGIPASRLPTLTGYRNGVWRHDQHVSIAHSLGDDTTFSDGDYVSKRGPTVDPYSAWLQSLGLRHHLSHVVRHGSLVASIGVYRPHETGSFGSIERACMAEVGRAIGRCLRVLLRNAELAVASYWDGATSGGQSEVCLLDGAARILKVTPTLNERLRRSALLRVADHVVRATSAAADGQLQQAVANTTAGRCESGVYIPLTNDGASPVLLEVLPVKASAARILFNQASALIRLLQPRAHSAVSERLIRELFGATAQEARIAVALGRGDSLTEIAAKLNISRETVRVHLKRLFLKTDTNTQAQLVQRIAILSTCH